MVIRIWKAQATPEGALKYRQHFENNVLPELKGLTGFREAYLLNRGHESGVDIEVHTIWESLEVIKAFATPNLNEAVVEPEAQAVLISYDKTVSHFEASQYQR